MTRIDLSQTSFALASSVGGVPVICYGDDVNVNRESFRAMRLAERVNRCDEAIFDRIRERTGVQIWRND